MALAHNGLAKLAEELGELSQVVGKLLAYPETDQPHPDGGPPLLHRLEDEIADVKAAIILVQRLHNLDVQVIENRCARKVTRFTRWHKEP